MISFQLLQLVVPVNARKRGEGASLGLNPQKRSAPERETRTVDSRVYGLGFGVSVLKILHGHKYPKA